MNFKPVRLKYKSRRTILFTIPIYLFLLSLALAQSTSGSISFSKKEIAFFKWGNGTNEIGHKIETKEDRLKNKPVDIDKETGLPEPTPILSAEEKKIINRYWGITLIRLDGNDNIYLSDPTNHRMFFIKSDGKVIRSINNAGVGFFYVDEAGDVINPYFKRDDSGFICTHPDGTQTVYKYFDFGYLNNGIVYDQARKKAITILDNGDKAEKFAVGGEVKYDKNFGLIISTQDLNKHLRKINKHIDRDSIGIKFEEEKGFYHWQEFLGFDDDGNAYVLWGFPNHNASHVNQLNDAFVGVYSPEGSNLAKVPFDIDYYKPDDLTRNLFVINSRGDIYQAWESDDGVHIFKWVKK